MLRKSFVILLLAAILSIAIVVGFSYLPAHVQGEIVKALDNLGKLLKYLTARDTTGAPIYFSFLSLTLAIAYLYVFVPITIVLASYVLLAYSVNMINGGGNKDIPPEVKFRRGVAALLPFLLSLYVVLADQFYQIPQVRIPFYATLIAGFVVGFLFIFWVSRMPEGELFATLSCFVSSTIFFSMITVFVITRSFEIISFVFGFLFGISVYIIRYGFVGLNLRVLSLPNLKKNA